MGDYSSGQVVRELVQDFDGKLFRLVLRLSGHSPPTEKIGTAHCLAFSGDDIVLTLHAGRDWTIPGGHLESGEGPLDAMHREAKEEAGITVADPFLLAHEEIDPLDGRPVSARYTVPSFQVFYVARLVHLGDLTDVEFCSEARLFSPSEARRTAGWIADCPDVYEAALELVRKTF